MTDYVVVSKTVETQAKANQLADALVTARLAACVQAIPIQSTYHWKGKVEHSPEILLQMKTQRKRVAALLAFVRERHAYELPELTVTAMDDVSPEYGQWICDETSE
jgi:periplasmic divalent cation tolerance protein